MTGQFNPNIFREYDIRGEVEKDFTPFVVDALGKAFGSRVVRAKGKSVAVGRDVRLSSDPLFETLSAGIRSTGCNVVDIGAVPTPLLYFAQFQLGVDAAVMITGRPYRAAHHRETGLGCRHVSLPADPSDDRQNPLVECECGGLVAPRLFREMGCEVFELFSEPDGTFPNHHPDPTVLKNTAALRAEVLAKKAELGIGYDGDADRIGVVDEKGNLLYGDQELMIFAKDLLGRRRGAKVIFDVKCTSNLPDYVRRFGGVPIMSATGHSIIKDRMRQEKAELAGEMSGHIFLAEDYFGYDDAIFATARMLKIVDAAAVPVSAFLADVPPMHSTPEIRVDCPDDLKFGIVKELVEYYRAKYEVVDIDGVRINFGGGWGLVRASNTQPVLVLRFEAKSPQDLERYKKEVREKLLTYKPLAALGPF
ncbi:MAG: phosphomannomutase/phosphoglucomutase, partial [Nitrospinae bacterium]|nr:phosphomannomutase/phosphoglucomutase [Nitrospinota bacterium]